MADFDAQIRESQEEVAKAQAKITEVTSRIEAARANAHALGLDLAEAGISVDCLPLRLDPEPARALPGGADPLVADHPHRLALRPQLPNVR